MSRKRWSLIRDIQSPTNSMWKEANVAQRTVVQLTDDLDGSELQPGDGETVTFSLAGQAYEIDLSKKNAAKMRHDMGRYIDAARKVSRSGRVQRRVQTDVDPKAVRAWAESQGIEVNSRGRIPAHIVQQFQDAGN